MTKELLQQALDALLGYKPHSLTHAKEQGSAIIALREAIAQPVPPAAVGAGEQDVARLDWLIQELEAPPWKPFWYASTSDYLAKARAAIDEAHGGAS